MASDKIGKLEKKLKNLSYKPETDTWSRKKVDLLNELAQECILSDLDRAQKSAKRAVDLAKDINYRKGIVKSHQVIGTIHSTKGAHDRALETLRIIFEKKPDIKWLTCSKGMGEDVLRNVGYKEGEDYTIVYETPDITSAQDTKSACKKFIEGTAEIILFCGGDGTARDINSLIGKDIPIIGIPAGVKMYSAVFGVNPKGTGEVLLGYLKGASNV